MARKFAHLPSVLGRHEPFKGKPRIHSHETGASTEDGSVGFQPIARNLLGEATSGRPSLSHVAFWPVTLNDTSSHFSGTGTSHEVLPRLVR
jgi:hypothetical protein